MPNGTHVVLYKRPSYQGEEYFNPKHSYSLNVLGISDPHGCIRYAYVRFPGSAHDTRVFIYTPVAQTPNVYFRDDEYILADTGYPSSSNVVPTYKKTRARLGWQEREARERFNTAVAQERIVVENTFGRLKGWCQSLRGLPIDIRNGRLHQMLCLWVRACNVLHNMMCTTRIGQQCRMQMKLTVLARKSLPK
ncbi:hypothetical protein PsorP6_011996 [Peronosclerospora sorghi]|uniref:Uncharacterized protein n=1 Tax=Peronosclerospora sorghi TaxID=230839 RepID=A0ACC0WLX6_9STRA|nr:hypothetical protein PsorP6_011996 [Peronosclerospora sorghi]